MATLSISRAMRFTNQSGSNVEPLLPFLFPPFGCGGQPIRISSHPFSTSSSKAYPRPRRTRENNKLRGMSALRSTGLNGKRLSVEKELRGILPVPVEPKKDRYLKHNINEEGVNPNHPLWGFFNPAKTFSAKPHEDHAHGNPWHPDQLRIKSFDDMHKIWWMCVKDLNRMATEEGERLRLNLQFGDKEMRERQIHVRRTMSNIKQVLRERHYSWLEAKELVRQNPALGVPDKRMYEDEDENDYWEDEAEENGAVTDEQNMNNNTTKTQQQQA
ncbi:MRP-L47-domain-containing protein [Pseudovirgaria hyperparasitica]|uniref:Large ribosomal subunit protein uL29m n=1 Tax=Pseudovirgaria hyperparasitica TaxID=470096 RepID=A0A6A6WLB5_9PEZI|nr:MRP-L47-domain-containing protein [Pseudovirgaria hyperparasitica]KAF2763004.1 MRP-L47-domain-containing protein [Pseudovirgaria hyperparasitica]